MAEATAPEPEVVEPNTTDAAAVDRVVENAETSQVPGVDSAANGESNEKRDREEEEEEGVSKKQKVEEEKKPSGPVILGFKSFESSVEMFDYFYNLLHAWPPYLNLNKPFLAKISRSASESVILGQITRTPLEYEHTMLLELLKNGHSEPDKKIGEGILAFQVRKHSMWRSRCFFLIREDESVDDFSFRKCVDHILPLPEEMHLKPDVNIALGGSGGAKHRGGRGGGRGHGRRGKSRH